MLEALVEINAVSLARTELDRRSLMLVRIAALVAVDAPTSSYLLHVGPSVDAGLTAQDAVSRARGLTIQFVSSMWNQDRCD